MSNRSRAALFTVLGALILTGCTSAPERTDKSWSTSSAADSASSGTAATGSTVQTGTVGQDDTAPSPAAPAGEQVRVAKIVDGDTFELTDGRQVRVLGIDSCEMDTPGGEQAKAAVASTVGHGVTLTREPGVDVDVDRYGRLLRYVQTGVTGGVDWGEWMVQYDHTGIYDPANNDASRAYLDRLYAADLTFAANPPSGRECGSYPPPAPDPGPSTSDGGSGPVYVPPLDNDDDDDRVRVPRPRKKDNGGESRFCRKRWWC